MPISFAEVHLSDDRAGENREWINAWLPGVTKHLFAPVNRSRTNSISGKKAAVDMPTPNYCDHTPRINTLYWPTGAARWAVGLFLISGEELDKIITATYTDAKTSQTARRLDIQDLENEQTRIQTDMFMLQPIAVSPRSADVGARGGQSGIAEDPEGTQATSKTSGLWILPLVDERYYWQQKDVDVAITSSNRS